MLCIGSYECKDTPEHMVSKIGVSDIEYISLIGKGEVEETTVWKYVNSECKKK